MFFATQVRLNKRRRGEILQSTFPLFWHINIRDVTKLYWDFTPFYSLTTIIILSSLTLKGQHGTKCDISTVLVSNGEIAFSFFFKGNDMKWQIFSNYIHSSRSPISRSRTAFHGWVNIPTERYFLLSNGSKIPVQPISMHVVLQTDSKKNLSLLVSF